MIGEDRAMADLPWASEESKNLVAASASRYGFFGLARGRQVSILARGRPSSHPFSLWTRSGERHGRHSWSEEMSHKRSGVVLKKKQS